MVLNFSAFNELNSKKSNDLPIISSFFSKDILYITFALLLKSTIVKSSFFNKIAESPYDPKNILK